MNIPNKLQIVSDGNELAFDKTIKLPKSGLIYYQYVYVSSTTKVGDIIMLSPTQLESMLNNNIAKPIK